MYVPRRATRSAQNRLEEAIQTDEPLIALTGPEGMGKRLLLRLLRRSVEARLHCVEIKANGLASPEICAVALAQLGGSASSTPVDDLARLAANLGNGSGPRGLLLLIHGGESLSPQTVQVLFDVCSRSPNIQAVIAAHIPSEGAVWLKPLDPRILRIELKDPMTRSETAEYIRGRLDRVVADRRTRDLFSWSATTRLWRRTGGNPRLVNLAARRLIDPGSLPLPARRRRGTQPRLRAVGWWIGGAAAALVLVATALWLRLSAPTPAGPTQGVVTKPERRDLQRPDLAADESQPPALILEVLPSPAAVEAAPVPESAPAVELEKPVPAPVPAPAAVEPAPAAVEAAPVPQSAPAVELVEVEKPVPAAPESAPAVELVEVEGAVPAPVPVPAAVEAAPASVETAPELPLDMPAVEAAAFVPEATLEDPPEAAPSSREADVAAGPRPQDDLALAGFRVMRVSERPLGQVPGPAAGRIPISVNAVPPAEISIDGHEIGPTPIVGLPVPPGNWRIVATFANGTAVERQVEVEAEEVHVLFP
jgi:hypothetical protein